MADLADLTIPDEARANGSKRRKIPRWVWVAAGAAALLLLAVVMAGGRRPEVSVVTAASPGSGDAAILSASGYVTPRRRATVAAKITGRVVEMLVEEGMKVEEGQVLARLDDSDARKAYEAARAQRVVAAANVPDLEASLELARLDLVRVRDLLSKGFVSQQEVDQADTNVKNLEAKLAGAKASVAAAQAQMAMARQDMDNCVVKAPFAGIAVSKDAQVGEMVSPISAGGGFTRTGISTVVDMDSLEVEVDVNESYIAKVFEGQRAESTLDAYPEWKIPCRVRTIIPTADRQKATVKVRIAFDALDPRILPDMGAKVIFFKAAGSGSKAAAVIPRVAVRQEESGPVVFLLKGGSVVRTPVTLGDSRGSADVEVLSGLAAGDQVVERSSARLKDGTKVKVKKAEG